MTKINDRNHRDPYSIDFDRFRTSAAAQRSQAIRDALKFNACFRFAAIIFALALAIGIVSTMRVPGTGSTLASYVATALNPL